MKYEVTYKMDDSREIKTVPFFADDFDQAHVRARMVIEMINDDQLHDITIFKLEQTT